MSERATCWSITINNPIAADEENIAAARQKSGWKVEGQLEQGENGTPHYQLMVCTPQTRFSAIKKAFPRSHIEVCRNKAALAAYVRKEETRTGELPQTDAKYPSLAGFYKLLIPAMCGLDNKNIRVHWEGGWYDSNLGVLDQEQRLLDALDAATAVLIYNGYHVESIAVNPQTRSGFKRFGLEIIHRTMAELEEARETKARQTEDKNISAKSITTDETSDAEQQDGELYEGESSDGLSESGGEEEDEGSDEDTEGASESFSESDSGD